MLATLSQKGVYMLEIMKKLKINMLAIPNLKRTLHADYTCNLFQWRTNMIAMSKIVLEARDYDIWKNLLPQDFFDNCKHMKKIVNICTCK